MISAIFMICILLLSVMFIMHFNGQNKDIYMFIYVFIYLLFQRLGRQNRQMGLWLVTLKSFVGRFIKVWAIEVMGGPDEKETEMICDLSESIHVYMQYF